MLNREILERIYRDKEVRTAIVRQSHYLFFTIYFASYLKYPTAPFQREIFSITEDPTIKLAVIAAFRGSAKSTIVTTSFPIWSILGEPQKKFVVILSQTQYQAKQHLLNLKRELESNYLLRADLGPFEEQNGEWGQYALVIPRYDAKIMAASVEQSIRGFRRGYSRPDLIICDDVEDLGSVKTKEGRDKTYRWLTGDVIPAGDHQRTRIIIVGNLLHEDSLVVRLKETMDRGELNGIFRFYPLIWQDGTIAWPGKFPNLQAIEELKRTIGDDAAFQREYLLHIVSDADRVVWPEWIHYYDVLPKSRDNFHFAATGIDLAISERDTGDFTAMVSAKVYGYGKDRTIYILPNPVNTHLPFPATIEKAKWVSKTVDPGHISRIYVEDVGYQKAFPQMLENEGFQVECFKVGGQDKRSRIALTTHLIKSGHILFPQKGAEQLIQQLTGFGAEKHDDLADAFTTLVIKILEQKYTLPEVMVLDVGPRWSGRRSLCDWEND